MLNCSDYRELLLDYLYGLLDEPEAQALRDHLTGCSECQRALEEAKHQQSLFARAALTCRDVPVFEVPADETLPLPTIAHFPRPTNEQSDATTLRLPSSRVTWRRWVSMGAAAALLLAVGSVYGGFHRGLEDRQKALTDARKSWESTDAKLLALSRDFAMEKVSLAKKTEGQFLHLEVLGPATYQPSAPNIYTVSTGTPTGQSAPGSVSVKLIGQNARAKGEEVLFAQTLPTKGSLQVVVPAKLKVKPGDMPRLVIEANTGQAKEGIEQPLEVEQPNLVTHLALNKSSFRPGETMLFRTLTLDRFALTPVDRALALSCKIYRATEVNYDAAPLVEIRCKSQEGGISGGEFLVPYDWSDGPYLVVVDDAESAKGKPSAVRPVSRSIFIEGSNNAQNQNANKAEIKNAAPPLGAKQNPTAEFFPEGGDLVADNIAQRVYFRLNFPLGVPASLEAVVEDSNQKVVAKVNLDDAHKDRNAVLGSFAFLPRAGDLYRLRISSAGQAIARWPLPAAVDGHVTLSATRGVVAGDEPIPIKIVGRSAGQLLVLVNCRGRTVQQWLIPGARPDNGTKDTTELLIEPAPGLQGVMRITVYGKRGDEWRPLAERLVYREPSQLLKLKTSFDKNPANGYKAGDQVRMTIETRDETNGLQSAWLHALVLDKKLVQPLGSDVGLPACFLLSSEVRHPEDLEEANVLLGEGPKAAKAFDLYLGTQGWRRFATNQDGAPVALLAKAKQPVHGDPAVFVAGTKDLVSRYSNTLRQRELELAQETAQKIADQQTARDSAAAAARQAALALAEFEQMPLAWLRYGVAVIVVLSIIVGAGLLFLGLIVALRKRSSPRMMLAGSCATLLLGMVIFASASSLKTGDDKAAADLLVGWLAPRDNAVALNHLLVEPQVRANQAEAAKVGVEMYAAAPEAGGGIAKAFQLQRSNMPSALPANNLSMNLNTFGANAAKAQDAIKGGKGGGGQPPVPPAINQQQGLDQRLVPPPAIAGNKLGKQEEAAKHFILNSTFRQYANMKSEPLLGQQGTLLWQPALAAPQGSAQVSFELPAGAGDLSIFIHAHTADGRLATIQETLHGGK